MPARPRKPSAAGGEQTAADEGYARRPPQSEAGRRASRENLDGETARPPRQKRASQTTFWVAPLKQRSAAGRGCNGIRQTLGH